MIAGLFLGLQHLQRKLASSRGTRHQVPQRGASAASSGSEYQSSRVRDSETWAMAQLQANAGCLLPLASIGVPHLRSAAHNLQKLAFCSCVWNSLSTCSSQNGARRVDDAADDLSSVKARTALVLPCRWLKPSQAQSASDNSPCHSTADTSGQPCAAALGKALHANSTILRSQAGRSIQDAP